VRDHLGLRLQFSASEKELHDIVMGFHQGVVNGNIFIGWSGQGGPQSVPARDVLQSKKLAAGTTSLQQPVMGSHNPDPAHSPDY
jgi:hypothetical protein